MLVNEKLDFFPLERGTTCPCSRAFQQEAGLLSAGVAQYIQGMVWLQARGPNIVLSVVRMLEARWLYSTRTVLLGKRWFYQITPRSPTPERVAHHYVRIMILYPHTVRVRVRFFNHITPETELFILCCSVCWSVFNYNS